MIILWTLLPEVREHRASRGPGREGQGGHLPPAESSSVKKINKQANKQTHNHYTHTHTHKHTIHTIHTIHTWSDGVFEEDACTELAHVYMDVYMNPNPSDRHPIQPKELFGHSLYPSTYGITHALELVSGLYIKHPKREEQREGASEN